MVRKSVTQRDIAQALQRVFPEPGDSYDPAALAQLEQLGAAPLILLTNPNLFSDLVTAGLDLHVFVPRVLKCFRIHYSRTLAQLKQPSSDALRQARSEEYNQIVADLGHLVDIVIPFGHLADAEIELYLDSADPYLSSHGARLLEAMPSASTIRIGQLLDAMERTPYGRSPYAHAPALTAHLDADPTSYEQVFKRFDSGNENLRSHVLQAFCQGMTSPLPPQAQRRILDMAHANMHGSSDLFNLAIIALSVCHAIRAEAIALLAAQLDSNLWFVRGNAAVSLGLLGVDDEQTISRIADLLSDPEGYDWNVCSAALEALAALGPKAIAAVPHMLALVSTELDEEDIHGYPCAKSLLANAFGAIGEASPEVIEALRKLVEKQGFLSAYPATIALGKLGPAALPALGTIKAFLFSDEMPADSGDKASELIGVLQAIAGNAHPIVPAFTAHLAHSPFEEVAAIARIHNVNNC